MAEILSFEAGRKRFADRHADRIANREEGLQHRLENLKLLAQAECQKWMDDLSSWPSSFFSAVTAEIRVRTMPKRVLDEHHGSAAIYRFRAGTIEDEMGGWYTLEERVRCALATLRRAARALHEAKARGHKGVITRRRRELREMKDRLLLTLWLYGRPKIVRCEFEPYARREIEEQRTLIPRWIEHERNEIGELVRRLQGGVYLAGAKKGQPLSEMYREQKQRRIDRLNEEIDRHYERLHGLEAEPDPLRAWRFYAPRIEARV